jgi:hypothetical protein
MEKQKELKNYFPHDSNARNSDKLIRLRMKHKAAGYGVYFMILERMREDNNYMSVKDYNMIAFDLREDASLIKSVVEDFGLFVFTEDGKYFYSESFNRRMVYKDEKSQRRSEAGKKGMSSRWKKDNDDITTSPPSDNKDITMLDKTDNNVITKASPSDNNNNKGNNTIGKDNKLSSPLPPQGEGGGDYLSSSMSQRDGIKRNLEGLCMEMRRLGISQGEQDRIMKLSNYGELGHPVWTLIRQCADSISKSSFDKSRIKMPGRYIISKLKEAANGS